MPAASQTLVDLEQHLAARLLALERLDEAWPSGRTAIERAEIRRQREDALSGAVALRDHIVILVPSCLRAFACSSWMRRIKS